MFRLLHTADWHVGKTIARRDRADEHREVLREICEIAQREAVDGVLVCGDLFEHQSPAPESEELVYQALLELDRAGIPVVIIPGNHDDPRRWRAVEPLLRRCRVTVVPEVRRPPECIVSLKGKDGTPLQIAAIPWISERRWTTTEQLMGLEGDPQQRYAERMRALLHAATAALDPGGCTVLAAHLFMDGSLLGGGERQLTVSQTYAVTAPSLPQVQYCALGHVHRPQRVASSAIPAYYAGSPLQLDFGELGDENEVRLVELQPGLPAQTRAIPLQGGRRLREVRGALDELEPFRELNETCWLRVLLECESERPGLADQVREILPSAVDVRLIRTRAEQREERESLSLLSPRAQFERYLRRRADGQDPNPALLDLFEEVLEEVA